MIEYKTELRIQVNLVKGILAKPDQTLDKEIIQCARKCLKGQRLIAWFYAYHCVSSWQEIRDHFSANHNSKLTIETVQRYAREAAKRIADQIAKR